MPVMDTQTPVYPAPAPRKRRVPLYVTLAAIAVVVAGGIGVFVGLHSADKPAASMALAVTPPASTSPRPAPTPAEPRTYDAAKAAVDRIDAASAAHDWGTLWDMLTASGQAAMTKADYIKVSAGCPALASGSKTLSIAMNAGNTTATVTTLPPPGQGDSYTWSLVYENGHWKHQPSDGAMQWMVMGADKALATLRQDGACG